MGILIDIFLFVLYVGGVLAAFRAQADDPTNTLPNFSLLFKGVFWPFWVVWVIVYDCYNS